MGKGSNNIVHTFKFTTIELLRFQKWIPMVPWGVIVFAIFFSSEKIMHLNRIRIQTTEKNNEGAGNVSCM